VLIFLFGFFLAVNSRLSGVSVSLVALVSKYCLMYSTASSPMNIGNFSFGISILHGVVGFGSRIFSRFFILSSFMVCGSSPDWRMIVKNAFSRILHSFVILLISFSVMSLLFIFSHSYWVQIGYHILMVMVSKVVYKGSYELGDALGSLVGHRAGRRKRERELREKESVEKALDVEHRKHCPICGKKLERMSLDNPRDREVFDALESGKCPKCGSGLKVTAEGILYCSKRPLCGWCVYISGLK